MAKKLKYPYQRWKDKQGAGAEEQDEGIGDLEEEEEEEEEEVPLQVDDMPADDGRLGADMTTVEGQEGQVLNLKKGREDCWAGL